MQNIRPSFRDRTCAALVSATTIVALAGTALAGEYRLTIDEVTYRLADGEKTGVGFNGISPGPTLRFKEGEDVVIHVTNNLDEQSSIHWHGLILPPGMDGVPTISFDGIAPGETFTYRFPIVQSGTYWFHSHSGFQEPDGAYGSIVIEPTGREPFRYDRDYVVVLKDGHPHAGSRIMRNLKMMPDYYNRQQRTAGDFFRDVSRGGLGATLSDRADWGDMRMMPTDIEDVHGFTGLINGRTPEQNWTGLFTPGERIRLRFINASAMTYFDVRIPGLRMTVVQADGNNVQPVPVDEFRIAVAETYDVIVHPQEDQTYTLFAESMGRSGFGRATLAPRAGMEGAIPARRSPPLLTMADMGHAHGMDHGSMDHGSIDHGAMTPMPTNDPIDHGTMGHRAPVTMDRSGMDNSGTSGSHAMPDGTRMDGNGQGPAHGADPSMHTMPDGGYMAGDSHAGHGNMATADQGAMGHAMAGIASPAAADPFYAAGSGLAPTAADGGRFLSYADLRAQKPLYPDREATREITLRLTGNMERYVWSINGVKYGDADPIRLRLGERVRFTFINETMMAHPMHLHGMWSILDNGNGKWDPVKHVVSIAPATTVSFETEVDAPGAWAFHCHLSYHAASGMFRKVIVDGGPKRQQAGLGDMLIPEGAGGDPAPPPHGHQ